MKFFISILAFLNGGYMFVDKPKLGLDLVIDLPNHHQNIGQGNNNQDWPKPQLLFQQLGYILLYPSLQPLDYRV